MDVLLALPAFALVLIALVLVVQLGLMIWSLVDLVGRPAQRLRGPKWLWAVIIVLGELVGPIVYLLIARLPEAAEAPPAAPDSGRAAAAADVLYGSSTQSVPPAVQTPAGTDEPGSD